MLQDNKDDNYKVEPKNKIIHRNLIDTPKTERFSRDVKKKTKNNRNYAKSLDLRLLTMGNSRKLI